MANFPTYPQLMELFTEIGNKLKAVNGALVFRGNTTFANLPSVLTAAMVGYVYNVTNEFTTDDRFNDGVGLKFPAGTNVCVADLSTISYTAAEPVGSENPKTEGWYEEDDGVYTLTDDTEVTGGKTYYVKTVTLSYKFEVGGAFVDVEGLEAETEKVADMITTVEFDDATAYTAGDVVKKDNVLYKFKVNHSAGVWNSAEVDTVTVVDLITAAEPDSLTTEQVNALIALLN